MGWYQHLVGSQRVFFFFFQLIVLSILLVSFMLIVVFVGGEVLSFELCCVSAGKLLGVNKTKMKIVYRKLPLMSPSTCNIQLHPFTLLQF